jgi:hypothetical protein
MLVDVGRFHLRHTNNMLTLLNAFTDVACLMPSMIVLNAKNLIKNNALQQLQLVVDLKSAE